MDEVLNSVKKKHRAKHKRKKRELKKLAQMQAAVAADLNGLEVDAIKRQCGHKARKKPLQVATQENQEAIGTNGNSILHHFSRTPKKCEFSAQVLDATVAEIEVNVEADESKVMEIVTCVTSTPQRKANAFEVMMNARKQSLGTNSTGKEITADDKSDQGNESSTKVNRKLLLQNWAERKGAKRKCEEESRVFYVEEQLKQRAKRLKRMFAGIATLDNSLKSDTATDSPTPASPAKPILNKFKNSKCRNNNRNRNSSSSTELISNDLIGRSTRRSCTFKNTAAIIDQPVVNERTRSKTAAKKTSIFKSLEKNEEEEMKEKLVETIDLDDSTDNNSSSATPKQLAPLFRRSLTKPSPDLSQLEARRNFLHSGVPQKIRTEQTRQKQFDQSYENCFQLFPSISHVGQQLQASEKTIKLQNAYSKNKETDLEENTIVTKQTFNLLIKCKKTNSVRTALLQCRANVPLAFLPNKRFIAKAWKLQYERFPTFKCYNQLREKYRYFSAIDTGNTTQQVSESLMVTCAAEPSKKLTTNTSNGNQEDFSQPPAAAPNGELLFTDKYKPQHYEQMLVSLTPVNKLRDFLAIWCVPTRADVNQFDSDDTLFQCSPNGNTVVLLGPKSSGKTNAVFALANELNFNVLEINAGMKRTGKRLVQELQEATQSHQVRSKQTQLGFSKRNISAQDNNSNSSSNTTQCAATEARKSLILIEDADVAFEQIDAGFIDAIYTLASASKRPVIVVASNPHCLHLQRLMQQNTIHFASAHTLSISRYLALLSLIENCPVSLDDIVSLYLYNGLDTRRTIMELQLFVQSGGDLRRELSISPSKRQLAQKFSHSLQGQENASEIQRVKRESGINEMQCVQNLYIHQTLFDFYTLDQNKQHRIPFPIDFDLLDRNMPDLLQLSTKLMPQRKSTCSPKKAWLSTSQGKQSEATAEAAHLMLCDFYEHVSLAAWLDAHDQGRRIKSPDLCALTPRISAADLTDTLVENAVAFNLGVESNSYNLFNSTTKR